jgi:hypothetical protein
MTGSLQISSAPQGRFGPSCVDRKSQVKGLISSPSDNQPVKSSNVFNQYGSIKTSLNSGSHTSVARQLNITMIAEINIDTDNREISVGSQNEELSWMQALTFVNLTGRPSPSGHLTSEITG